jgi:hypothetical protein
MLWSNVRSQTMLDVRCVPGQSRHFRQRKSFDSAQTVRGDCNLVHHRKYPGILEIFQASHDGSSGCVSFADARWSPYDIQPANVQLLALPSHASTHRRNERIGWREPVNHSDRRHTGQQSVGIKLDSLLVSRAGEDSAPTARSTAWFQNALRCTISNG